MKIVHTVSNAMRYIHVGRTLEIENSISFCAYEYEIVSTNKTSLCLELSEEGTNRYNNDAPYLRRLIGLMVLLLR